VLKITDTDKLVDWTIREIKENKILDPTSTMDQIRFDTIYGAFKLCAASDTYDYKNYAQRILIRDIALYYTIIECLMYFPEFISIRDDLIKLAILL
jgi:hypothetical protein